MMAVESGPVDPKGVTFAIDYAPLDKELQCMILLQTVVEYIKTQTSPDVAKRIIGYTAERLMRDTANI